MLTVTLFAQQKKTLKQPTKSLEQSRVESKMLNRQNNTVGIGTQPARRTCATDDVMQELFRNNPEAKAHYLATQASFQEKVAAICNSQNRVNRTQSFTVPVVVHILIPNPNLVTDATCFNQIDTLNWFYGGAPNGDSLRVYQPFQTAYGRSSIRFCMAQRTPSNTATNGIERVVSNATFTAGGTHPSTIVPAWDPTKYLNIWVVTFTDGTLGYSYLPGAFTPSDQRNGFVNDYRAFGSGGAYEYPAYNLGRTAVHEIGHYFNLNHPFVNGPACVAADGCADLPASNAPTFGCPSPPVLNTCQPAAPGVMWQNHMDYADDACMFLFTNCQTARMDAAITTFPDRVGLTTSNGCQPIAAINNEIRISTIVNPSNGSSVACPTVAPVVTIQNMGTNTVTSASINLSLNGGPVQTQGWSGSLSPGASTNYNWSGTITPVAGANTLKVYTSFPNGVPDANPSNDTAVSTFTKVNGNTLPLIEGFESATYPPTGWSRNPTAGQTWARVTTAASSGTASSKADFYNYGAGTTFSLTSPAINVAGTPQVTVKFDIAHQRYDATTNDRLIVEVSSDCGATWTQIYNKSSFTGLTTVAGNNFSPFTPTAAQWRNESVSLTGPILASGSIQVRWTAISDYGNNLYLDNINIDKTYDRDLGVTAINSPGSFECGNSFVPQVVVKNLGLQTVTSYDVIYRADAGTPQTVSVAIPIAPGGSAVVNLAPITYSGTPGAHTFQAATNNPVSASGSGDQNPTNDALTKNFTRRVVSAAPLVEGFEGPAFPPNGWSQTQTNLAGGNPLEPWRKATVGYLSNSSMWMNNYDIDNRTQWSDMVTLPVDISGVDSIRVEFDVAAAYYSAAGFRDTLIVLVSTDCGNTFVPTGYKKTGPTLSTIGAAALDAPSFVPSGPNQWRHEMISLGGSFVASGNVIVKIRNAGNFGQNIYVDNINIRKYFGRDLKVTAIPAPDDVVCAAAYTPSATVQNVGYKTITAFRVGYRVNGGTVASQRYTTTLAPNASTTVTLPAGTFASPGQYSFEAFSFTPVVSPAEDSTDQNTANDTLRKSVSYVATVPAPLAENFENAIFPPGGWGVRNPDQGITWSRNTQYGKGSTSSAYMNNFNYNANGRRDDLFTPILTYSGVDSVFLYFDVAASSYSYPGSTRVSLDTLEVLVTKDCGATAKSVYKKWGLDLSTQPDAATNSLPNVSEYAPYADRFWRKEFVDLSSYAGSGPIQILFRNTENFENNIYVDNVNLSTKTVPARLKQYGYMITPNPFNTSFTIQHYPRPPVDLRGIQVVNSLGQIVWNKSYSGNADAYITVDLGRMASGIYYVKLIYDNRKVTQKIIKQ